MNRFFFISIRYTIATLIFSVVLSSLFAQKKEVKAFSKPKEIEWLSIAEVEQRMKTEPRKVYVDIYTDWCGWCKVMEKKTFTHPKLIEYLNNNYYCIRFNAEAKDTIVFNGKKYGFYAGSKTNELAVEWMQHKLSYPSSIFMEENFKNPQPVPGYLEVPSIEMILKYFGGNHHKKTPWEKYKNDFVGEWK